jgi:membrane-associated phospholipid phosphatase
MNLDADTTSSPRVREVLLFLVLAAVGVPIAHALDLLIYQMLHGPEASGTVLALVFRGAGYLPLWTLTALALVLHDTARLKVAGMRGVVERGLLILLSVVLSGTVAEVTKSLVHRRRPPEAGWDGRYTFCPFDLSLLNNTDRVGMPSGHSAVAFGAACMLARMYPRATPLWLVIGAGCAGQRLLDRAHFFSDVFVSVMISYAVAWLVWHGWRRWAGFVGLGHTSATPAQRADRMKLLRA